MKEKNRKKDYLTPCVAVSEVKLEGAIALPSEPPPTSSVEYEDYYDEPEIEQDAICLF
jgi:hypothetical protein